MKLRLLVLLILFSCKNLTAQVWVSTSTTGEYSVLCSGKIFKGNVGHSIFNQNTVQGNDKNGAFNDIKFSWEDSVRYDATIRYYDAFDVVLFFVTYSENSVSKSVIFPHFTEFPKSPHTFSYYDDNFAPAQFKLNNTSTPWLFFDDSLHTFLLSPASNFMVAKMKGDGEHLIGVGLNEEVTSLPQGFTQASVLVIDSGIQHTWNQWGSVLRNMYNRVRPANDADITLKYFGYWTDNGADYYYNYDTTKGYASTLVELVNRYKQENIPLGYLQLDSWWYDKSIYDVDGKPVADHKNKKLPYGMWNRYGGLMSYTADSFLFPNGLHAFQQQIGLPLITHNRWVDPHSPYHDKYNITGFAAVDSNYWNHILQPISKAGVICYEQDWLNYIYSRTPQMASDINVGNVFTDAMANESKKANLNMQYCMAMPRHFLQGLKYNNLTTIRTSEDRFNPENWKSFLYTSQFGYEIGAWPWCDVFKSGEKGNMILAVLSAGVVGTGDAIGKENKENIMKACRIDGVLVKPDVPILPLDNDYLNEAKNVDSPFLAYTYTSHNNIKTGYLFAFTSSKNNNRHISFSPSMLNIKEDVIVFNPELQTAKKIHAADYYTDELPEDLYEYYIIAPITSSGIAFLGNKNKIAATGKKRIADIKEEGKSLKVTVAFAKNEMNVLLQGYSEKPIKCEAGIIQYNSETHLFLINVSSHGQQYAAIHISQKK